MSLTSWRSFARGPRRLQLSHPFSACGATRKERLCRRMAARQDARFGGVCWFPAAGCATVPVDVFLSAPDDQLGTSAKRLRMSSWAPTRLRLSYEQTAPPDFRVGRQTGRASHRMRLPPDRNRLPVALAAIRSLGLRGHRARLDARIASSATFTRAKNLPRVPRRSRRSLERFAKRNSRSAPLARGSQSTTSAISSAPRQRPSNGGHRLGTKR